MSHRSNSFVNDCRSISVVPSEDNILETNEQWNDRLTTPWLSHPSSKSPFSRLFKEKSMNEQVRIGDMIIFHLSKP